MVTTYGMCGRAGVGGEGIEVPLDPMPVIARQVAARLERQAAALAAGPAARRRRRPGPAATFTPQAQLALDSTPEPEPEPVVVVAAAVPPPVPEGAGDGDVVEAIEDLVPAGPVACERPGCTQLVMPEYVARTGSRLHGPCRTLLQAAETPGPVLVGAGARS